MVALVNTAARVASVDGLAMELNAILVALGVVVVVALEPPPQPAKPSSDEPPRRMGALPIKPKKLRRGRPAAAFLIDSVIGIPLSKR